MKFKALLLGVLFLSSPAYAQSGCNGQPASGLVCGNGAASQALPGFYSQSTLLDKGFGATPGVVVNRGSSVWSATATPTLGQNGGTAGSVTFNGSSTGSALLTVGAAAGSVRFQLPPTNGTNGNVLQTDGSGNTSWVNNAAGGTVTSVGLALPSSILTVSGSPVTLSGTLTGTLATQSANSVWAGPTSGGATTPTFRSLVGADLPNPGLSSLGGVQASTSTSHQWINQIDTSGVPQLSQPAFTDISGTVAASQLPNPTASTLGGIESFAPVAHEWINTISTAGVPSATQPNFTDLAGAASLAQLPSISNNSVLGNNSGGTAIPSALTASNVLDFIATTQGDVLYRNGTTWVALAPGTNGQVLTTGGAAANPSWTTVTGTGTVTNVATSGGLTGGPITTTGTLSLASISTGNVLANVSGISAGPTATTPSAVLDVIGSTTGNILYRSSGSGWQVLAPGSNGQVLTMGATTPAWQNTGSVTNVTISAGTGISSSGTCNITTTGTCTVTNTGVVTVKKQVFTGSGTYTPSTGMLYAMIECQGPGAGGGGIGAVGAGGAGSGGGGGAGAYSRVLVTAASVGASKTVTVGTGGAGGTAGPNNGSAGSAATSVGTLCVANSGTGGTGGTGGAGGAGGTAGTGDLTLVGNAGGGGSTQSFVSGSIQGGHGGASYFGGAPVGQTTNSASGAGASAGNYGSGGNGAISWNGGGSAAGGAGGNGVVFITEYNSQ